MTAVAGNTRLIYAAIQSAKGSVAAAPTHRFVLSADQSLDPSRSIITLPETDSSSQAPSSVVVGSAPAGGWTGWLRSSEMGFLARSILGLNSDGAGVASTTATGVQLINSAVLNVAATTGFATTFGTALLAGIPFTYTGVTGTSFTGCGPHAATAGGEAVLDGYVHTATPSQTTPYLTLWDVIPGIQCTQYVDARLGSLALSGQALGGITYATTAMALTALLNATEPVAPTASATDRQLAYPDVTVTVGGVVPGTHDAFTLLIQRNLSLLHGDLGLASFDSQLGTFEVSGTLQRIYENANAYNQYNGGSAAATALTRIIFAEAFDLLIQSELARSVRFTSANVEYTQTTVPVNVAGAPIIMARSFRTQRAVAIASNLTVVTKNGLATSVATPA